ncbi:toprim domain-containing protein [Fulvivirgaceae bacterium BMA12]|uniref:Toprim domain-containing protein n=1 Tax=Agaribacillus aureus TaxID=3051825 RepID=A0ABT8LCQ2_9BACT|nr:toprim domain-containing protein [Fulvivirgaceae bacterium BMA12]
MIDRPDFSRIKQEINLTQYAACLGYKIDRKKSTRSSIVMRQDNADKIIISKRRGIWVYFSVYDDQDNGTVIDFAKNRTGKSLSEVGEALHLWFGDHTGLPEPESYIRHIEEQKPDPERINRLFGFCRRATNHAYLESRGITEAVLRSPRFEGRVFQDHFNNAVFPHFREGHICGLELRNEGTGLFVRGSEKTLWRSNIRTGDNHLIIAETPIDAISYHILFSLSRAFYIATGGGFSTRQGSIINKLLCQCPQFQQITLITDNDQGGNLLARRLNTLINDTAYGGEITRHSPAICGQDWNDVLREI